MKYVYSFFAVVGVLVGLFFWTRAESGINQIEVLIIWLIAAVLMVAAEICEVTAELRRDRKTEPGKPPAQDEPVITERMIRNLKPRPTPAE